MDPTIIHAELEPLEDIEARISKTFAVLEKVANGVVRGNIKSIIVSGAAGCGKTYTLDRVLGKAKGDGLIHYQSVKGSMSAIGLYRQLWECREAGSVLVIDDCDSIFADLDALNLLKAALDTTKTRMVHWNKESRVLDDENIDRSFEFDGAVVFITNIDFSAEIEADRKMTPHYRALLSRCMYVDLGIHNKREILVRIGQVVFSQSFLRESGMSKAEAKQMMAWITRNLGRVRTLSIRTVLQLASLIKTDNDWESMAASLMLRSR